MKCAAKHCETCIERHMPWSECEAPGCQAPICIHCTASTGCGVCNVYPYTHLSYNEVRHTCKACREAKFTYFCEAHDYGDDEYERYMDSQTLARLRAQPTIPDPQQHGYRDPSKRGVLEEINL